ncbi:flagellar hook-associated protein FlgL [Chromobacterium vaccinii]|uniref:Flagellar hook-associated protein 3 n=1 Tax=Chromobacterium vaccinii TaxID=1108595 RepID=A0A1D9LDS8_9NEIS|nr:flagellar hook-associated protein FlgL [Chromobacterium vaccinii]AOZ49429.1 flagellar hook-associated protein 3 [Chromobacterium vaccinii]QND84707.1 Flagellar hook-associated protein FlgL [Chromobacterium vaccinii]QND89938.1 Flagellar hook-associated protein FlgL [Chromobacterium vaccinii]SUX53923.1 Hook-filament junction protein [Chromobacterium vaccinii]
MRISSTTLYQSGVNNMSNLQAQLVQVNTQIDYQKRVVTPSDDPVAAARIELLNTSSGQNTQYKANTQAVDSWLSYSDTSLKSAIDLMGSLKSQAIYAGSGALSTTQLQAIQKTVKEGLSELVGYANATDGNGSYLFSGNQINTAPFALDLSNNPPTIAYNGDDGQRSVQVSSSRIMAISDPGNTVFGSLASGGSPTAAFDSVINLYNLLGQNPKPANFSTQINTIINQMSDATQQMSIGLASVGAREQENSNLQSMSDNLNLQYNSGIGDLQNLDMAQAISQFTLTQTSLQYTQKTYAQVAQLSLFNYISG